MKTNKWFRLTGLVLASHLILVACQPQSQTADSLAQASSEKAPAISKKPQKEQLQERLVVSLTADGYELQEGEKKRSVKGRVPEGLAFAPELYAPKDYVFKASDVQYELKQGYVVKIGKDFYFWPKGTKAASPSGRREIPGVTVATSDGFLLDKSSKILSRTKDGIVVDHDGHAHFIFYSDLVGTTFAHLIPKGASLTSPESLTSSAGSSVAFNGSAAPTTDDGYVFNPADIVAEDALGYTVRHGDHFHYILKSSLGGSYSGGNGSSSSVVPGFLAGGNLGLVPPGLIQPAHQALPAISNQPVAGLDRPTSDGFLFDGSGIVGWTSAGLLVDHGGHLHVLLTSDLINSKWAHLVPGAGQATRPGASTVTAQPAPSQPKPSPSAPSASERPQPNQARPSQPAAPQEGGQANEQSTKAAYLAAALGLSPDQLVVLDSPSGPGFLYPHGDHHHFVLLSDLDVTKPFDAGHDDHHEHHEEEATVPPTAPSEALDSPREKEEVKPSSSAPDKATQPAVAVEPTKEESTPAPSEPTPEPPAPAGPVSDEVAPKRAYLAEALGLSPDQLVVLDSPSGPGFLYPHGDHHHFVLLSELDVTKPFDAGHDDHHEHHEEEASGPPTAPASAPESPHGKEEVESPSSVPAKDAQPAVAVESTKEESAPAPAAPAPQPPAPATPVSDEVASKRAYLAEALGLSPDQLVVLASPSGPGFLYPHGDHHHFILLSELDVTKPFDAGHDDDHDHHEEESTVPPSTPSEAPDSPHGKEDVKPSSSAPDKATQPAVAVEPTKEESAPAPAEPAPQPTPPAGPVSDEVASKRAYLAEALSLSPDQLLVLDSPSGPGFLYPHGDHHHFVLLSDLDVTKPFDAGHGHRPAEADKEPSQEVALSEHLAKQRELLAQQFGLPLDRIGVVTADGKVIGFEHPHDDHMDFIPVSDQVSHETSLSEADKKALTAYIRKAYGLLQGTPVTFHDQVAVFAIPHPHQDYDANRDYVTDELDPLYDPGHVHPYSVPLDRLRIPEVTGIPEVDFENELLAAAERLGISPHEVSIKDGKYFVLPGKDHDHYLNILTPTAGYESYLANKLPDIRANFQPGDLDKARVLEEVASLLEQAATQYGKDSLDYRRIARSLATFEAELKLATTSTQAYLEALKAFDATYIKGEEVDTQAQASNPLQQTYQELTEQVRSFSPRVLATYGLTPEGLITQLKSALADQDAAALTAMTQHLAGIARVEAAPSDLAPRLAYMDFLVRALDSGRLPADLQAQVADKVMELHQTPRYFKGKLGETISLKTKVAEILSEDLPSEASPLAPLPQAGFRRQDVVAYLNQMRDFVLKRQEVTPEELAQGFDQDLPLFLPSPAAPAETATATQPTPPSAIDEEALDKLSTEELEKLLESLTGLATPTPAPEASNQPENKDQADREADGETEQPTPAGDKEASDQSVSEQPSSPDDEEEELDLFDDWTTEELEALLEGLTTAPVAPATPDQSSPTPSSSAEDLEDAPVVPPPVVEEEPSLPTPPTEGVEEAPTAPALLEETNSTNPSSSLDTSDSTETEEGDELDEEDDDEDWTDFLADWDRLAAERARLFP